jgi:hypothetical protein
MRKDALFHVEAINSAITAAAGHDPVAIAAGLVLAVVDVTSDDDALRTVVAINMIATAFELDPDLGRDVLKRWEEWKRLAMTARKERHGGRRDQKPGSQAATPKLSDLRKKLQ